MLKCFNVKSLFPVCMWNNIHIKINDKTTVDTEAYDKIQYWSFINQLWYQFYFMVARAEYNEKIHVESRNKENEVIGKAKRLHSEKRN